MLAPSPEPNRLRNSPRVLSISQPDHVRLWVELKRQYTALRGARTGRNRKPIPKTTRADVLQMATRWSRELTGAQRRAAQTANDRSERDRWQRCLTIIDADAAAANESLPLAVNQAFWDCSRRLAIYLESLKIRPSRWRLLVESVTESVAELPGRVTDAGRSVAEVASSGAQTVAIAAALVAAALLLPPILRAARQ